jgi:ornithine carbamoyltransferase
VARVYQTETLEEINRVIDCPVVNALCDKHHPSQALADLMCIQWHKENIEGLKVTYVGDGNNVANSLMQMCAIMGMDFTAASPKNYSMPVDNQNLAESYAKVSGSKLNFVENPFDAVENADVVYTDTFISMGEEADKAQKIKEFKNYQINQRLMDAAKKDALFMHCLPAHREEEVSTEVIDGKQSVVFDQAECRMHIAKAILTHFLGEE